MWPLSLSFHLLFKHSTLDKSILSKEVYPLIYIHLTIFNMINLSNWIKFSWSIYVFKLPPTLKGLAAVVLGVPAFPPEQLCLCVSVGAYIHKSKNPNPPPSLLEFCNKISSCIGGHHDKQCMRGLVAPWPLLQTHTQNGRLDYDH